MADKSLVIFFSTLVSINFERLNVKYTTPYPICGPVSQAQLIGTSLTY